MTGNQALRVKAGLKAITFRLAGCADANVAGEMYPTSRSTRQLGAVGRAPINNAMRADQIQHMEGKGDIDFFAPVVADAEAGFGGVLNAFELMKSMIEAGAAGVHFEDQLAAVKKCGHMGGKVLVPTREAVEKLVAARLAADCMVCRRSCSPAPTPRRPICHRPLRRRRQRQAVLHRRAHRRSYRKTRAGFERSVSARPRHAQHADLIWCEANEPDLDFAKRFADPIQAEVTTGKMLAYNCSPSVQLEEDLDDGTIGRFQRELGAMGYRFQFITLAQVPQLAIRSISRTAMRTTT
jgi:isocitrate lyase